MKNALFFLLGITLLGTSVVAQSGAGHADAAYLKELQDWQDQRVNNLKAPNGWLNLVGLYWLEEGPNTFGSGAGNKVVFPAGSIAAVGGVFERSGDQVKLIAQEGVSIKVNGREVKEAVIFDKDSTKPATVESGNLRWTIIKRDDKIGVRLRDLNSPLVTGFPGIHRYPTDTAWRINAIFQPATGPANIAITNILGQTSQQNTPGKLLFTIGGVQYTLDALDEGGDAFFVIFGDETSGKTTYPSGRFLAVKKPAANSTATVIDFNKAYNPPCAFTHYATCPLPPRQNILPVAVTAGEKDYGNHGKSEASR